MLRPLMLALLGTSFTFLMTALGAATVFFFARKVCERAQGALLGGAKLRDACVKAGEFVRDTIAYTAQQGTDPNFGVQFEKLLPYLWQK